MSIMDNLLLGCVNGYSKLPVNTLLYIKICVSHPALYQYFVSFIGFRVNFIQFLQFFIK